jgi:hypothetical protein
MSGDADTLRKVADGSIVKTICLFFLFVNPVPSEDELSVLKQDLLTISKTSFDHSLINYVCEPFSASL